MFVLPQKSYLKVIRKVSAKFCGNRCICLDASEYYTKLIKRAVPYAKLIKRAGPLHSGNRALYPFSSNAHNKYNEKRAVPYAPAYCIAPIFTAVLPSKKAVS